MAFSNASGTNRTFRDIMADCAGLVNLDRLFNHFFIHSFCIPPALVTVELSKNSPAVPPPREAPGVEPPAKRERERKELASQRYAARE